MPNRDPLNLASPQVSFAGPSITSFSPSLSELPKGPLHHLYAYYFADWSRIRDCLLGERAMKAKSTSYIPKLDNQDHSEYNAYLDRAYFVNGVELTVTQLAGQVFRRPPTYSYLPPTVPLASLTKDGESLNIFLQSLVREILAVGRAGILLDRPSVPNAKPYVVLYKTEEIINWAYATFSDGITRLSLVILLESSSVLDEVTLTQSNDLRYRILRLQERIAPDGIRRLVYSQQVMKWDQDGKLIPDGPEILPTRQGIPLDFIPFKFVNTYSLSATPQKPPMIDIANVNVSHFRSTADLEHGRHFTAMPTYYISGSTAGSEDASSPAGTTTFTVGPNNVWLLDENDKAGILEFNGAGLKFIENAVSSKEGAMMSMGSRLIGQAEKTAAQSKVQSEEQASGERSVLLAITYNIDTAISGILEWYMDWEGIGLISGKRPTCELNKEFENSTITAREMRAIESLYNSGLLPSEGLWKCLREARVIPTSMDLDEFEEWIEESIERRNEMLKAGINPDGGGPGSMNLTPKPTRADKSAQTS